MDDSGDVVPFHKAESIFEIQFDQSFIMARRGMQTHVSLPTALYQRGIPEPSINYRPDHEARVMVGASKFFAEEQAKSDSPGRDGMTPASLLSFCEDKGAEEKKNHDRHYRVFQQGKGRYIRRSRSGGT